MSLKDWLWAPHLRSIMTTTTPDPNPPPWRDRVHTEFREWREETELRVQRLETAVKVIQRRLPSESR